MLFIERKFIIRNHLKNGDGFINNTYMIKYLDINDVIDEMRKTEEDAYVKIEVEVNDEPIEEESIKDRYESESES